MNRWILAGSILAQTLFSTSAKTQGNPPIKWINPATDTVFKVEGRLQMASTHAFYDRLPAATMDVVRKEVAQLATNTAGEYIRFTTNSTELVVRYQVKGSLQMPHMPATGVSGLDLYGLDEKGNWHWASGRYSFGDTISYRFTLTDKSVRITEYRLYLPLYNAVRWMELGVPEPNKLQSLLPQRKAPIIIYGTSILQGACASRPGLAWSNILGRMLNVPVINLGFSGNGRMEKELIDLIASSSPGLVVLDCLPNLVDPARYTYDTLWNRYQYGIGTIRKKYGKVPIVLTQHCSGLAGTNLDNGKIAMYTTANEHVKAIYAKLVSDNTKGIYLLTIEDIGFSMESTVDGVHPNDIGMMQYAVAYKKLIEAISMQK